MDVQKMGASMEKLGLLNIIKENTLPGRLNVLITTQVDLKMGIETIVKRITDIEGCEALAGAIKEYGVPIQLFVETKEVEEFRNLLHRRIKVKIVMNPL